jgi:hypothetical protein
MVKLRGDGAMTSALVVAAVIAFGALIAPIQSAHAAEGDAACLGCHGAPGLEKKLKDNGTLSLHVPGEDFAKSVHNAVGCAACHADKAQNHPGAEVEIASARAYSIASIEACRGCHADKFKQFEGSIHAILARDGNPAAPVCTDCHSPHAVVKGAAASTESMPCKNCHTTIFEAYAGSMHGQARRKAEPTFAPLCSGCHTAHAITAASAGDGLKSACLGCHGDVLEAHRVWLPNAGLHFEVISCPACHAPTAQRRVDLRLVDSATQTRVAEQKGIPLFEGRARAADGDGKGLDAIALWNLLKTFNREGMPGKTTLQGRLEVRTGAEAHMLADKSKAISDCKVCHRAGSDAFQSVTVSVVGPDGRPIRYGANKEVLSSVVSIDSVSGFYAIGGTRIQILDILLILAVLGGLAVPVGHMTLGWFVRQTLKRNGDADAPSHPHG